jgi:hypothetical protein
MRFPQQTHAFSLSLSACRCLSPAPGIQQFIVDQRYLMQFSARFKCGEEVNTSLMEMIQRAVIAYCRSSGSEPQTIIKVITCVVGRVVCSAASEA